MGRADGTADESKERTPEDHSASDRGLVVDAAKRADGRSKAEANCGSDQRVSYVARTHSRVLVAAPVISMPRRSRHPRPAPGQLSQRFAIVASRRNVRHLCVWTARRDNLVTHRKLVRRRPVGVLRCCTRYDEKRCKKRRKKRRNYS